MTRTIEHGNRNGYASLGAGGLSPESFPMRLFAKGNAKHWNPAEIDFAQDAKDFAAMTDDERWMTMTLAAQFLAGEESVTQDLQPFIAAMAAEDRLADEMYLTQFVYEEAKHTLAFRLWFDAVGLTQDLHEYIEYNDPYMQIFTKELPASLYALEQDASPQPDSGIGHLQPRHRGGARADRLLRLAEGVHQPRNTAWYAEGHQAHRRRRASAYGVGHLHVPPPRRGR